MHRTRGKDHRHRNTGLALCLVAQDEMPRARPHRIFGLGPDTRKACLKRARALIRPKGAVDPNHGIIKRRKKFFELGIADKRAFKHDDFRLRPVLIKHVLQVPKPRLKAHDAVFAKRVDRRVCHLAKVLAEEMRQRAVFFERTALGVSSPIDAMDSLPSSAIGARICSSSSIV